MFVFLLLSVFYDYTYTFITDLDYQLSESRLVTLIRLAVKDTDRVWELAMAGGSTQENQKMIEECMLDMGLIPETEEADVNVSFKISFNSTDII